MELSTIAFVYFAFLTASFLKGVTGLGFASICLPMLSFWIDPKVAIPVVMIPSLASNVLVLSQAGGVKKAVRRFWPVYACTLPGLFLGVTLLYHLDGATSRKALGVILMAYSLWAILSRGMTIRRRAEALPSGPVGLCSGVVAGLTGSLMVPFLPYMLSLRLERDEFVSAINLAFTLASFSTLLLLQRYGMLDAQNAVISLCGVAIVAAGVFLGGKVRRLLHGERYKRIVLCFLLAAGVSLLLR